MSFNRPSSTRSSMVELNKFDTYLTIMIIHHVMYNLYNFVETHHTKGGRNFVEFTIVPFKQLM